MDFHRIKTMFASIKFFSLAIILLTACTEQLTAEEQSYKEYCASHKGAWMKMSELKDGQPTGKTCYGCMPDEKNHLCTQQEYEAFVK
jgi:hypothetical protein